MPPPILGVLHGLSQGCIVCGDCVDILTRLPANGMVFADPPDNRGLKYDVYDDKISPEEYASRLRRWLVVCKGVATTLYFSVAAQYAPNIWSAVSPWKTVEIKQIIWRFTFGQHNSRDLGSGYRPIFRIRRPDVPLYPDAIRVPSARQTKYNDKRANPFGKVPDDVWDFPRVCGTFHERQAWHPTQHPVALVERAILLSTQPDGLVIDPFVGSGTTCVAAKRTGRRYIGIDISPAYVEKARERLRGVSTISNY